MSALNAPSWLDFCSSGAVEKYARDTPAATVRSCMRKLAMELARCGYSDDVVRDVMREVALEAAERAIDWAAKEDAAVNGGAR